MRSLAWARYWLAGGVVLCVATLAALLAPPSALTWTPELSDKIEHVVTFAGITGWFCGVFERRHFVLVGAAVACFAGLTEVLQWAFTYDRQADFNDFTADIAGIGVAMLLARMGLDHWSAWIERRFGLE